MCSGPRCTYCGAGLGRPGEAGKVTELIVILYGQHFICRACEKKMRKPTTLRREWVT